MNVATISLRSRQISIFVGIIIIVLPALFISIEQAYHQGQVKALEQQLEANLYSIVGEIDLDVAEVAISNAFLPPALNQIDSATEALIEQHNQIIWRSDSALNAHVQPSPRPTDPGQSQFFFANHYWHYTYALFYDNDFGTHNVVVHVRQHEKILIAQMAEFRSIILKWFIAIASILVLSLAFALWSTLRPIERLDLQIKQVEKGLSSSINGQFPKELTRVQTDLNLLISQQNRQKNRYRSYLSDLTHALKTPVAVLRSSAICNDPIILEQLDRMTLIIEHQLRKAASAGEDVWKKQIKVLPITAKILGAMAKIYRDKDLIVHEDLDPNCEFFGDESDLMEILGNLIDNACKAARAQIRVTVTEQNQPIGKHLQLIIEDDGPGIAISQREKLLIRGQRLDTYSDGHGVGMAIVNDLINSYQATLVIADSALGGAKFVVDFQPQDNIDA